MHKHRNKKSERGIALLVALFALILISAVGLAMIFSSDSELGVNQSYRQNHLAYFAARSGLEEARDRMRYASTDPTTPAGMGISDLLPTNSLGLTKSVLYIVNVAGVDPTNFNNNTYFDDELCHDLNNPLLIANSPGAFNIKCPHAAASVPTAASWNTNLTSEPIAGGGKINYAWTRINLKMQESTNPWCVLGLGNCTQDVGADPTTDQVCYDGQREFVITDAMPLRDAPGGIGGISLPQQLAMGMYFGGTSGHSASGHSSTTSGSSSTSTTGSSTTGSSTSGTSGTGSTTGSSTTGSSTTGSSTTGSSTTGSSTTGSSTTGSSTTGSSTTGSSTTGSSTTGSSTTGSSTTGSSTTGSSTTGSSTTGSSTTGSSTTGSSTTGSSTTGSSTTGSSTTGSSTTGSSTTGSSTTGSSTTGSSTTGSSSTGSSTTGSSTTGTSTAGTSTSGSSTGGTTGGGGTSGSCSGLFTPSPPPASFATSSCANANGQPVYTLTTLALAPNGARRMLQYEIARITLPPVPAALTMAGPNPNFGTPHSNNFGINGNDGCATGGHSLVNVPAIGTTTDVGNSGTGESAQQVASDSATTVANAIFRPGNFTGPGCSAGPQVQNVINVAPDYNTVDGLNAVVQSIIGSADEVATSGSGVSNWGTDANPKVIAITGDASLSSGAGILLVTGNATASGGFSWDGIVLVIGKGSITVNGGGSGAINGAMVVANIGDSTYATDPTNYSGHLLPQLGSPTFNWNGGGNNFFQYNSCFTTSASQHAAYKVLARREIVY